MKIKSIHDGSFIELTFCRDNADAPQRKEDMAIDCKVFSAVGFCGKRREIWFLRETLDRFVRDLEAFERTRRGAVTLARSPQSAYNDFDLTISAVNSGQTMLVEIDMQKIAYTPDDRIHPFRVSAHFVFDPSMLLRIVTELRHLFRTKRT